jgi:hypothetical protein
MRVTYTPLCEIPARTALRFYKLNKRLKHGRALSSGFALRGQVIYQDLIIGSEERCPQYLGP